MAMEDKFYSIGFLLAYMVIIWIVVILSFVKGPKEKTPVWKWVWFSFFVLALGDFFHLVPRTYLWILFEFGGQPNIYNEPLGIALYGFGLITTSITVTLFYTGMYMYWKAAFVDIDIKEMEPYRKNIHSYNHVMLIATMLRMCLIAYPQNNYGAEPVFFFGWLSFRYIANIPLYVLGILDIYLFLKAVKLTKNNPKVSENIRKATKSSATWFAISYICYSITLFGVQDVPMLGMFMIPKTVAYIIALFYFYKLVLKK